MSFRNTFILFGLFLAMLWLFGLMVNIKRSTKEETFVMPIFHADQDEITVDSLRVERRRGDKKEEFVFTKTKDAWTLQQPPTKRAIKVEEFRIKNLIRQVADAQAAGEVDTGGSPASYGLDRPTTTVTITGHYKDKPEQTWQFFIGKDSPEGTYYYVNSSERRAVQGVKKSSIDAVLLDDVNQLRPQRLFDTSEFEVKSFDLKEPEGSELALKRTEEATWLFVTPPLGQADAGGAPPPPPSKFAVTPPKQEEGGVKALLGAIIGLRVETENFVPVTDAPLAGFGLEEPKVTLRIQLTKSEEKKEAHETLLVGNKEKDTYYARMANDEGVFKLPAKSLERLFAALKDPGSLRSRDLLALDTKKVDALDIHKGKEVVELRESENWQVAAGDKNWRKASKRGVEALVETLQAKQEIKDFLDKKDDKDLGLDSPTAKVDLWLEGVEKEEKKDEKKDKKADAKKAEPKLKKDAKPAARLEFGKVDGDNVYVKRTLWVAVADKEKKDSKETDKTKDAKDKDKKETKYEERVTRVAVPKTILEKLTPKEGALAFLDTSLPKVENEEVVEIAVQREKKEPIDVRRNPLGDPFEPGQEWQLVKGQDLAGRNLADVNQVRFLLGTLSGLQAQKWLVKVDAKEDLEKYGLKTPPVTATLLTKKAVQPTTLATAWGLAASRTTPYQMAASLTHGRMADKGERVVYKFGKELKEDEKTYVYAQHSGSELLFLVSPDVVKGLRDVDVRDRSGPARYQTLVNATLKGLYASPNAVGFYLSASPLATGTVQVFDPAKAKEIVLTVRTPYELRKLHLVQTGDKDTAWQIKSGLEGFTPDTEKVQSFLKDMAALRGERFVQFQGGRRPDYKLGDEDATLKAEIVLDSGKLVLTVGGRLDFRYFADTSAWPGVVFLLSAEHVQPLLDPARSFGKERVAAGP